MDTPFQVAQAAVQPATGTPNVGAATEPPAVDPTRVERFQSLFQDAARSAQPADAQGVQAARPADGADRSARDDALRSLELDGVAAPGVPTGDTILGGLSRLREAFDVQQARLQDMASMPPDPSNLVAVQLEVVQYGMLVDVTSKLTGKATQSFDTLMKGQ